MLEYPTLMELCPLLEPLAMGPHDHSFPQFAFLSSDFFLMPPSSAAVYSRHGCFLSRSPTLSFSQFFFVDQNYATRNRRKALG